MRIKLPAGFQTRHPLHWLAFGFGSGLSPYAPGSAGSLLALPFFLLWRALPPTAFFVAMAGLFLLATWICERTSRDLGVHDHSGIVIDEFLGQWLTLSPLILHRVGGHALLWFMLLGFLLFRVFDIVKPWPIRWVDRHVHGGFGIMFDDLLAAVMAALLLGLAQVVYGV